ncbi:hypothetical protein SLS64_012157 [Diaporthe eres]|uniref:Uncharacterized protein n=1 Tax=Diaporthe eres TaxID=83184 RepID=A0ABR1PGF9_DIAER
MVSDQASAAASEDNQLLPVRDDQDTRATQSSSTGSANLPEFPIEGVFRNWSKDEHVQDILSTVYATHGDWEGWVRVEIDLEFRDTFSISNKQPVREVEIYKNAAEFADLVLKPDKNHKGLIIELICEDKFTNKGSLIKDSIQGEMDKERELKEEFKGYTFKVLAITYSKAAETAVRGLGLTVMPGIEVNQAWASDKSKEEASDEQPVTLRVFQKNIPSNSAGGRVDETTASLGELSPDDKEAARSNNGGGSGTS